MPAQQHEFQAETRKLLDLMIHSLYSHKEVFLRELISNASDAIDRRSFAALTDPALRAEEPGRIVLRVDPSARTLEVEDNGIGMSESEVVENLGTIARSGTERFSAALETQGEEGGELPPELIGQFGVGFYASFMVASEVSVETRKAGEDSATRWRSSGEGGFEIGESSRASAGTVVRLTLLPADADAGLPDFCDEFVLRETVKRYSDFVGHPIELEITGEDSDRKGPEGPLNSMKAIWTRPEGEVSEQEHRDFYRHIAHDWNDPLLHLQTRIEGTFEARALLYIPSKAPFDLYHREQAHKGVQLYVKRVFIMDDCRDLLPEWLRFVRGVVDSEDLPLNVSREMLQQDRQIRAIRKHLVKRVLETLSALAKDDPEKYLEFWSQFGPVLKEGLLRFEERDERREQIIDLVRVPSTHGSGLTSVAEVVDRMPDDQEQIYYLTGASREAIERSPHLEAFEAKGIEVLFFTDPVDEIWLEQGPPEFRGKTWQSIGRGEVELGSEEERKHAEENLEKETAEISDLLSTLRVALQDEVAEVRPSRRLTSSPACLVIAEGDVGPQIKAMLRQAGQDVPDTKPILEVNASHALLQRLAALHAEDPKDERIAECAQLLYGQAMLVEGAPLEDPADFARHLTAWLVRALS